MDKRLIRLEISEMEKKIKQAWTNGEMDSFLEMSEKLFELAEKHDLKTELATAHNFLGLYNNQFGNYDKALEHFFAALEISSKQEDKESHNSYLSNIGMTYGSMRNVEKSLEYYLKAHDAGMDSCEINLNIGFAYKELGEYEEALKFYDRAEMLSEKHENRKLLSWALMHSATINTLQDKLKESEKKLETALKLALEIGDEFQIAGILYQKAKNLHIMKDHEKAVDVLNDILARNEKVGNMMVAKNVFTELANIYHELDDMRNAYKYKSLQLEISEKVFNDNISDRINNLQKNHKIELERWEKSQKKIQKEKAITEQKLAEFKKAYSNVTGIGQVGIFSYKMKEIVKLAGFFHHDRNVPVLIEGATGSGKEIIARIVHYGEEEISAPFITINCSAITESLFESELFGYVDGAFTGAKSGGMIGKMELAQGGTLFLDEIGELPLSLQPKLLRALQQREIYRIGGSSPIKLDVRIICATNRNLHSEIEKGNFREDLFYRLNTGKITIPPLSERKEEIAPLAQVFLMELARQKKKNFRYIDSMAVKLLEAYEWPGNVRELRNVIERATLLYDDVELKPEYLEFLRKNTTLENMDRKIIIDFPEEGISFSEIERIIFSRALKLCDGNKTKLAKMLDISVKTIYRRKL
jgi:transcriptional regulator with PAS, ATPase and Fis domain